jgi:galactokinase
LQERYITLTVRADRFQLYRRVRHVFSESLRVTQFKRICTESVPDQWESLAKLGKLMNESHMSCDQDFDCSCAELNELTALARFVISLTSG